MTKGRLFYQSLATVARVSWLINTGRNRKRMKEKGVVAGQSPVFSLNILFLLYVQRNYLFKSYNQLKVREQCIKLEG
jgi:hypothetical protein